MKYKLEQQQRDQVKDFVSVFTPTIDQLAETKRRIESTVERRDETQNEMSAQPTIEALDDNGIARRLVLREKLSMLNALIPAIEHAASENKRNVAAQANDAAELFRRICYAAGEKYSRETFAATLPAELRKDQGVFADIWSRLVRRDFGIFFNPPAIDPRDDVAAILSEANRRLSLLEDLLAGKDIPLPQERVAADAA